MEFDRNNRWIWKAVSINMNYRIKRAGNTKLVPKSKFQNKVYELIPDKNYLLKQLFKLVPVCTNR